MSSKATILFVDDEERFISRLRALCKDRFNLLTTTSPAAALDFVRNHLVHVVISDQAMPQMQGIDLLREVREISPQTIRILLTGYTDLAAIIGSVNEGEIYRYLYKPWSNKDLLEALDAAAALRSGTETHARNVGVAVLSGESPLSRASGMQAG